MFYFYVLQSQKKENWFYKGSTSNLKKRIEKHSRGLVSSTKPYLPLRLVYYEAYLTKNAALSREMSVKHSGSVWIPLMKRIKKTLQGELTIDR